MIYKLRLKRICPTTSTPKTIITTSLHDTVPQLKPPKPGKIKSKPPKIFKWISTISSS